MEDFDGDVYIHAAHGTRVAPGCQHLSAGHAGHQVVARLEQAVPQSIHADSAVPVQVTRDNCSRWAENTTHKQSCEISIQIFLELFQKNSFLTIYIHI